MVIAERVMGQVVGEEATEVAGAQSGAGRPGPCRI